MSLGVTLFFSPLLSHHLDSIIVVETNFIDISKREDKARMYVGMTMATRKSLIIEISLTTMRNMYGEADWKTKRKESLTGKKKGY